MTIAAIHSYDSIANIGGMFEFLNLGAGSDILLLLAQDSVAKVAILGDNLAGGGFVLAAVTAETAGEVKMADVIGIGIPGDLHVREEIPVIDALDIFHGLPDGCRFFLRQFRVIVVVIFFYAFNNGG